MLNALISHKDQTAVLILPMDRFSLQYELAQIGIRQRLTDIPISDEEERDIQVKLFADSDIGNKLAVLFNSSHSLEDANLCAHMVENARPELLEELEQHIVHGQYHSPQAVMADIKAMTDELISVTVNWTTEQGKYCGKYALTELLVCGECGTPYRRCTWTSCGKKRIVWRCINRLDYGKKYCHQSPTMEEAPLQEAIMNAVLKTAQVNPDILQTLKMDHIQKSRQRKGKG